MPGVESEGREPLLGRGGEEGGDTAAEGSGAPHGSAATVTMGRTKRITSEPMRLDPSTGKTSSLTSGATDEDNTGPGGWREYFTGKYAALTLALVVLVAARTCDQTLYYRLNFSYSYFVWYFSAVILAVPISFLVVWYKMLFTDQITPEMRKFPHYKFAIMALFDTSFNVFSTFPVQHLGGDLSNVLSQTILPINMVGSFFFLGARFQAVHYLGAFLVIYGILVKLSPDIGTPSFSGSIGWILLAILSNLPSAASNVYKELGLKADHLDIWYANAWIGFYQIFWGVATFWTVFIPPFVAPHPPLSLSEFPTFVSNANKCFFGHSVDIVSNTTSFENTCLQGTGNTWDTATGTCTVDCDVAGTPIAVFCVYIIFNLTYNVLSLYVFQHGSSVLFVVANAVRLPLVDALNAVPFVSGQANESFGKYDAFALVPLVLAIFVYYSQPEMDDAQRAELEAAAARAAGDRSKRFSKAAYNITVVSPRVAGMATRNRHPSAELTLRRSMDGNDRASVLARLLGNGSSTTRRQSRPSRSSYASVDSVGQV